MGGLGDPITVYAGPTAMQSALMCQHAYGDVNVALEGGWKVSKAYKSTKIQMTNDDTGFKSQLYERTMPDGSKQYNYTFAGTEDGVDWKNNAQQIIGLSKQYEQAIDNARTLNQNLEGSLTFSGHSLGGGLATVAGLVTDKQVTTFNPAWMSLPTALENSILFTEPFQTNYIVSGEILNKIQTVKTNVEKSMNPIKVIFPQLLLLQQRGEKKFLSPDMSIWERIFNVKAGIILHKMPAVIKALEKSGYEHSNMSDNIDASEKVNIPNQAVQT